MANFDQLPQELRKNQAALQQVLNSPDTKKVLAQLQKTDTARLQSAAQSALQGDPSALSGILEKLTGNPETRKAMESLNKTLNP